MWNWLARPWTLGAVSPLQMLRGMLDMSLQWRGSSPLVGAVRLVLLAAAICGLVSVAWAPGRGAIVAAICLLGFFALRPR